jgi:hypothetical protein
LVYNWALDEIIPVERIFAFHYYRYRIAKEKVGVMLQLSPLLPRLEEVSKWFSWSSYRSLIRSSLILEKVTFIPCDQTLLNNLIIYQ